MANHVRTIVPFIVVVALVPQMFVRTAHSEPTDTKVVVPASRAHQPPSLAEQGDLEVIAKDQQVPVDEANLRFGWQEEFTQALTSISTRYPKQYASAEMAPEPGVYARVTFTGNVPPDAKQYFTNLPVPVEIVGGAKSSAEKSRADVEKIAGLARGVFDSPLGVEIIDEVIVVSVNRSAQDTTPSPGLAELQDAIFNAGLVTSQQIQVRRVHDLGGDAQVVVYGGGPLSTCTSGFTVRRTSGIRTGNRHRVWYYSQKVVQP